MKLTDTHSHLFDQAFDQDRDAVMERASEAGVGKILLPAIDSLSHERLFGICTAYPTVCFPMMGLHPTSVNDNPDYLKELEKVEELLRRSHRAEGIKFCAVGEVGLDLYWSRDFLAQQQEVFERQIELSLEYGLPLAIHTRSAWKEMVATLRKYSGKGIKGVMHSFSGTAADYRAVKECGDFLLGIGGPVTFRNSDLPELLAAVPLGDIVLETDSPYLTPAPFRGKRNESSYVKYICVKVAEIYGEPVEKVARVTTANAARMFGI